MNDSGTLKDDSSVSRNNTDLTGITNLFGFENIRSRIATNVSPSSPVNTNGSSSTGGTGQIQRREAVTLSLAATRADRG